MSLFRGFCRCFSAGLLSGLVFFCLQASGHESYLMAEIRLNLVNMESLNFYPCNLLQSPLDYQPIDFVILDPAINSKEVRQFLEALKDEKQNLMALYGISNRLYNELAVKAIGILGNESQFFTHYMYQYKANMPDPLVFASKRFVNFLRGIEHTSTLSKGPTAIKAIPDKIAEFYGLTEKEQLEVPFNAAVATVGYLAATYQELIEKKQIYKLECITEDNFSDMHLYLYFGGASYRQDLLNCEVHPEQNIYIRNVWLNSDKVQLFEYGPRL